MKLKVRGDAWCKKQEAKIKVFVRKNPNSGRDQNKQYEAIAYSRLGSVKNYSFWSDNATKTARRIFIEKYITPHRNEYAWEKETN